MKLKVKIQEVLVARICRRTDAIPKLPQRETESSTGLDVADIDLDISSFGVRGIYGFRKCQENEEV